MVASFKDSLIYLCGFSHKRFLFLHVFTQANKIVCIRVLKRRVFRLEIAFKLARYHSTVA